MKNHLGERTQKTFRGWKRALNREMDKLPFRPERKIDGDKDIAEGGYLNPISGIFHSLGHWDGEEGCIYKR